MALSDSQKKHYAWEFLKRSPEYREFWESHSAALAAVKPKSKFQYRRTREVLLAKKKVLLEDGQRAMGRWCLSKIVDPNEPLAKTALDRLLSKVVPVTPFFDAPWPGDLRLYLAIDPFGSLETIDQMVHAELKKHKARSKVPQRERKKPRQADLEYYLTILDCYRDHLSGSHAENRQLPNYGYTKGWTKLAEALNADFENADEAQLSDGTLVTALRLRDNSPFCFLG